MSVTNRSDFLDPPRARIGHCFLQNDPLNARRRLRVFLILKVRDTILRGRVCFVGLGPPRLPSLYSLLLGRVCFEKGAFAKFMEVPPALSGFSVFKRKGIRT